MDADVIVVGSGPAGSAAALRALQLRPQLRVVLVDRAGFPRDKACGDGVGPDGVALLDRLGVGSVLDGYPPRRLVRVQAPDGRRVEGLAPRSGRVVPRRVLDARLHAAARRRGAAFHRRRVRRLEVRGDRVVIDGDLSAPWVVAADGANSTVRRLLDLAPQRRDRVGLAIRGYTHDDGVDALELRFVTDRWPAYAWAFPVGVDGIVNVGYGPFDGRRVSTRLDLTRSLADALPGLEPDPASLRAHHLPLTTGRPAPVHGRVLLVGDAASLVHPLSGEGIAHALLSGALAGAAVARFPDRAGHAYRRGLAVRLGSHLRHTSVAARLLRRPATVDLAVGAAAGDPVLFGDLCEFALSTGRLTRAMVGGLSRHAATGRPARIRADGAG